MVRTRILAPWVAVATLGLSACGDDDPSGPAALECTGGVALSVGASVDGTLEEGDALDIHGEFLDRYALTVEQTATVEITMRSSDVDAFLWLLRTSGFVLDQDDDSGEGADGLDARIVRPLERGCYLVEATTSFAGQTGDYTLSVD